MAEVKKVKKRKWKKVLTIAISILLVLVLAFLAVVGWGGYYGPLKKLAIWPIEWRYNNRPTGEIVFYGASNFTRWWHMEEDLQPFTVQNHGFGGSTDDGLMAEAENLLYPYEPSVVVFQSGSNDFAMGMTLEEVYANKDKMYSMFRERLPDSVFVVMSMLPLPGRTEHWADSDLVNNFLREYCETHDNMIFVDATADMMTAEGGFRPELFVKDGIHLNDDGREVWIPLIKAALETATQK